MATHFMTASIKEGGGRLDDPSRGADLAALLPTARMQSEKTHMREAYAAGTPYPHVVIDGLWDVEVPDRIIAEFPKPEQRDWIAYDTPHELKQTSRGLFGLSPFTQVFLLQVCSPPVPRIRERGDRREGSCARSPLSRGRVACISYGWLAQSAC